VKFVKSLATYPRETDFLIFSLKSAKIVNMFKNLLGLTFIVATNAAGNGSSPLPEGTIKCDFNRPGTEVKQECPFYMACDESANKTLSGCILKGNTVCNLHQYLGESGDIVSNNLPMGCHPTESCCDGQCCSELQVCEELVSDQIAASKASPMPPTFPFPPVLHSC
jgi:hypothetical protein